MNLGQDIDIAITKRIRYLKSVKTKSYDIITGVHFLLTQLCMNGSRGTVTFSGGKNEINYSVDNEWFAIITYSWSEKLSISCTLSLSERGSEEGDTKLDAIIDGNKEKIIACYGSDYINEIANKMIESFILKAEKLNYKDVAD